ncbi:hypothetical protein G9A89_019342 [Geosiphon pyriformis]|nr:hypothetical protein G9A89_019342 [Geosiphon pyriformis]
MCSYFTVKVNSSTEILSVGYSNDYKSKGRVQTPTVTPKEIQPPTWKKTRVELPTNPSYHYTFGSAINISSTGMSTSNVTSTFERLQFQSKQKKAELLGIYAITANNWDNNRALQVISYFLQDTANIWYQSLAARPQTFQEFKLEFLKYFSNNNSINCLANIFTTIKQEDTEAVTTYLRCFQQNLCQIQAINTNYFTEPQILNQFICAVIFSFELEETTLVLLFSGATLNTKPITAMYTNIKVNGHVIKLILDSRLAGSIITQHLMDQLDCQVDHIASMHIITANRVTKTLIGDLPIEVNDIIISIKVLVMEAIQYQALIGNDWLSKTNMTLN